MKNRQHPFKKRGVDYVVPGNMRTLPRQYYQSEAIYQEEQEKIFYQRWLMACRAEEVPETGDYLLVPVGEESIILVRDKQQQIHAHFNVCRHRGSRVCLEASGNQKLLVCPYHAWTYQLDGSLRGASRQRFFLVSPHRLAFLLHALPSSDESRRLLNYNNLCSENQKESQAVQ